MKQEKRDLLDLREKTDRNTLYRLCSVSGLLLSIACCIALIQVQLRIQEQQRLISHTTTVCDQMETEILRKIKQNYKRWGDIRSDSWQERKGKLICAFVADRPHIAYWRNKSFKQILDKGNTPSLI